LFIDGRIDDMASEKFYNLKKGGNMKKFSMLGIVVFSLSLGAYNTAGKFGMGVRFWGSPIITFSNVQIGVSNYVSLEPSIGFYKISEEYYSSDFFAASMLANFKPIRKERSNLLLKLGGLYLGGEGYKSYAVLFGLGIEHFINDNFSVNVGALSGIWNSSSDYGYSTTLTTFGSQLVDFSLVWHLE
jgi:hypothetical protein